ncbi:MAG: phosphoglycolate phosphatase [Rhodospirillaceae bacterium]
MISQRFNAVVFDLDGTLIDSEPDLRAALNKTLAESGRASVTRPQVVKMIGDGVPKLVERGFDATGGPPVDGLEAAVKRFSANYEGHTSALSEVFPGVPAALAELKRQGLRLGVCTNKPQKPTEEILADFGLAGLIDAAVGGDALGGVRKPDGRHLAAVLEKLDAAPDRAVMVGDNHNDAGVARALGVPFVAVSFGYARGTVAELEADRVIHHFRELAAALAALAGAA